MDDATATGATSGAASETKLKYCESSYWNQVDGADQEVHIAKFPRTLGALCKTELPKKPSLIRFTVVGEAEKHFIPCDVLVAPHDSTFHAIEISEVLVGHAEIGAATVLIMGATPTPEEAEVIGTNRHGPAAMAKLDVGTSYWGVVYSQESPHYVPEWVEKPVWVVTDGAIFWESDGLLRHGTIGSNKGVIEGGVPAFMDAVGIVKAKDPGFCPPPGEESPPPPDQDNSGI
jgi:hypothetical protein